MIVRAGAAAGFLLMLLSPSGAAAQALLIPPVDHTIQRLFEAPQGPFGPGHRGIDYGVMPGVKVRAAAAGRVTFAGPVAGTLAVSIEHQGGLQTTYSMLSEVLVSTGQEVDQGRFIGVSGHSHPGEWAGLHFGVKLDGDYVDPLSFLGPVDVTNALHLAPLIETYEGKVDDDLLRAGEGAGLGLEPCRDAQAIGSTPPPPNDNVVVAIAGLDSSTRDRIVDLYSSRYGPHALGYRSADVYRFSYRGPRGPGLHEPYSRTDTYGDLRAAAARLVDLLARIGRKRPGADVDLIGHSQGGIIARLALEKLARAWDPRLPRVEHLVTIATPHQGAPLAGLAAELDHDTLTGTWVTDRLSRWARSGGPLPDPRALSIEQLVPGSRLLDGLAQDDVSLGTRVLSMVGALDVVAPAPRTAYERADNVVLGAVGVDAHDGILRSEEARAHAYSFLRDAPHACGGSWDQTGAAFGAAAGWLEGHAGEIYSEVETAAAERVLRALSWAVTPLRWGVARTVDGGRWVLGSAGRVARRVSDAWSAAVAFFGG
jgi:Peptidase family M23/PGAP1-like protein